MQRLGEGGGGVGALADRADQVGDLVGEGVLVAEAVAGGPPGRGVGVLRLGGQHAGEALPAGGHGRVVDLQLVHPLEVEGDRALRAVDLHAHRVLAALRHAGRLERAEHPAGEAGGEQGGVVDGDLLALAGGVALPSEALRGAGRGAGGDDGLEGAGDLLDRGAGQPLGQVDDVRADVAERPGAGLVLVQPPGHGGVGVGEPVLEVLGADLADLAHEPLGDQLARVGEGGGAAVGEAAERTHAAVGGVGGSGSHLLRLRHRVRQRLLAQHVLAGRERGEGDLVVGVARGADVDDVDAGILDQVLPASGVGGETVPFGGVGDRGLGAARDRVQHRGGRQIEEAMRGAPGMGVGGAHEAVADQADVQCSGCRGHDGDVSFEVGVTCRSRRSCR